MKLFQGPSNWSPKISELSAEEKRLIRDLDKEFNGRSKYWNFREKRMIFDF